MARALLSCKHLICALKLRTHGDVLLEHLNFFFVVVGLPTESKTHQRL